MVLSLQPTTIDAASGTQDSRALTAHRSIAEVQPHLTSPNPKPARRAVDDTKWAAWEDDDSHTERTEMVTAEVATESERRSRQRLVCHMYLDQRHSDFDIVPMLIGRGGNTLREIAESYNVKVRVRGKGSKHKEINGEGAPVPLMLVVTASRDVEKQFQDAVAKAIEKLERLDQMFGNYCVQKSLSRDISSKPMWKFGELTLGAMRLLKPFIPKDQLFMALKKGSWYRCDINNKTLQESRGTLKKKMKNSTTMGRSMGPPLTPGQVPIFSPSREWAAPPVFFVHASRGFLEDHAPPYQQWQHTAGQGQEEQGHTDWQGYGSSYPLLELCCCYDDPPGECLRNLSDDMASSAWVTGQTLGADTEENLPLQPSAADPLDSVVNSHILADVHTFLSTLHAPDEI